MQRIISMATPMDFLPLIRKQLPLVEVEIDTGPSTVGQLQSTRAYAEHLLESSTRWHAPLEVVLLTNWALNGHVPRGDRLSVLAPALKALA